MGLSIAFMKKDDFADITFNQISKFHISGQCVENQKRDLHPEKLKHNPWFNWTKDWYVKKGRIL